MLGKRPAWHSTAVLIYLIVISTVTAELGLECPFPGKFKNIIYLHIYIYRGNHNIELIFLSII